MVYVMSISRRGEIPWETDRMSSGRPPTWLFLGVIVSEKPFVFMVLAMGERMLWDQSENF
jgi:hypothetical protein